MDHGLSSRTAVVDNERTVLGARKREDGASASVAKERHASRRMEGSRVRAASRRRGEVTARLRALTPPNEPCCHWQRNNSTCSRFFVLRIKATLGGAVTRYVPTKEMLSKLPALVGSIALSLALVHGHPIWNIFNTRSSIDSLVTDSTVILAGGVKFGVSYYLATPRPPGTSRTGACPRIYTLTRDPQARLATSRYLSYPAWMMLRYSQYTMDNSSIT